MPCDVVFEYAETEDDNFRIKVKSLTGTSEDGTTYDLLYLTEDEDSMYSMFIIACVIENKQYWDHKLKGDKEWWEINRLGKQV
jgi:hypothetical protein